MIETINIDIEIIKPSTLGTDMASFAIGGQVSNYRFGNWMYAAWSNGLGGVYSGAQNYATTKTNFISRRISYGYTTTSNIIIVFVFLFILFCLL